MAKRMKAKLVSIHEAADIMRQHKAEILKVMRDAPKGWRVLAEVSNEGQWRGVGRVTPGTGSLMAHEGRGYAAYFGVSRFTSYADVEDDILDWILAMQEREAANA